MRLTEADWNAPGGVGDKVVEYPNEIGEDFLNWIRRTSAWRENPALVERRVLHLNRQLQEYRERPVPVADVVPEVVDRAAALKAQRQANMAKARAARAAKRKAVA